jgi:hypothetical protein
MQKEDLLCFVAEDKMVPAQISRFSAMVGIILP